MCKPEPVTFCALRWGQLGEQLDHYHPALRGKAIEVFSIRVGTEGIH